MHDESIPWTEQSCSADDEAPRLSKTSSSLLIRLWPDERWMKHFIRGTEDSEQVRQTVFTVRMCTIFLLGSLSYCLYSFMSWGDDTDISWVVVDTIAGYNFLVQAHALLHLYVFGMTSALKVGLMVNGFLVITALGFNAGFASNYHLGYVLLLDVLLVMQSEHDQATLHRLSILLRVLIVIYVALQVQDDHLGWIQLVPYETKPTALSQFMCSTVPILVNFTMLRSYSAVARKDARRHEESVKMASRIAKHLVNFDLNSAEVLLSSDRAESFVNKPLSQLLANLRSYRPFLPKSLFIRDDDVEVVDEMLVESMQGKPTKWERANSAARRLRDPSYSLRDFHEDVVEAFPELTLYSVGPNKDADTVAEVSGLYSSGLSGSAEFLRTMGAMYSIYCVTRLDMDGKDIFCYGVDENWQPHTSATCEADEKRCLFYAQMRWDKVQDLLVRANLLTIRDGRTVINHDRMVALLVLTAIHDVMKNNCLLPTVHIKHSRFQGVAAGSRILDHDVALAYIMENFPSLLPSFQGLTPSQRAPVLFSQSTLGFNNGWLVQGEAPPGPLFSLFKQVVVQGGASESEISFYFVHWLTDVAGAEPCYRSSWSGSDKFVLKFPLRVLLAFLDSFNFVKLLATKSEVEVMEEYLQNRWSACGLQTHSVATGCDLAAKRLVLMTQGFEADCLSALQDMDPEERDILAGELALTGLRQQFEGAPSWVREEPVGPAFLVYYAPALLQKAGAHQVMEALLVLAAVYRAARRLFPMDITPQAVESTVTVRIDALKVFTPEEILSNEPWHLRAVSNTLIEAVRGPIDDTVSVRSTATETTAVASSHSFPRKRRPSTGSPMRCAPLSLETLRNLENCAI
mmetsp:Transcript_104727/g.292231  ORF Transcript_104727/g.292231 Transcript_104727/m.292231 type:complete len:857 (+) Transcript_104727:66-2636(+)